MNNQDAQECPVCGGATTKSVEPREFGWATQHLSVPVAVNVTTYTCMNKHCELQFTGWEAELETSEATLKAVAERLRDMAALVVKCAEQFEFYERQHRAKGTPEADAKAEVNKTLAAECRAILKGGA